MEKNEIYNDLFELSADDFKGEEKKNLERYKPTAKAGKDNVYKSVIRFIPWYKDPKNKSIISKWTSWLVNPVSGDGKYIDCPSSVHKKSILQDIYWKLKKSESVAEQKLANHFSRRQTFASLVQIIKDDNQPDLVGKIMVFQYGVKIHNKLMAEIKPEYGKPHIPFDLFEGKPFFLNIKIVAGFNNYDDSKFLDEKMPLAIDGNTLEKSPENVEKIVTYLKENSPDLEKYGYQEWVDETYDFVNDVIKNVVPRGELIEQITKANSDIKVSDSDGKRKEMNFETSEQKETSKSNVPDIDELKEGHKGDDKKDDDDVDLDINMDDLDKELYDNL